MYNYLETALQCPHCGNRSIMEAEFRFGWQNLDRYQLHDRLRWHGGVQTPRQRPESGNYTGEGYVECPHCHRDFWITIQVQNDVITSAEVDLARPGYVPEKGQ